MMGRSPRSIVGALLVVATSVAGAVGPAQAAHTDNGCHAAKPGAHDPKAQIEFVASRADKKPGKLRSKTFEYGKVRDLMIEVRWERLKEPARQRVELYAPSGNLYQMFTNSLPAHPEMIVLTVPVKGSPITAATLAGTWCVKVFVDNDLDPVAAEDFELQFSRRR